MSSVEKGKQAEEQACIFLKNLGYQVLEQNYYIRGGEIDIIAKDHDTLVFAEVRFRKRATYGLPVETIDIKKQSYIKKAAQQYLFQHQLSDCYCRFDVIGILGEGEKTQVVHYKNAFQ